MSGIEQVQATNEVALPELDERDLGNANSASEQKDECKNVDDFSMALVPVSSGADDIKKPAAPKKQRRRRGLAQLFGCALPMPTSYLGRGGSKKVADAADAENEETLQPSVLTTAAVAAESGAQSQGENSPANSATGNNATAEFGLEADNFDPEDVPDFPRTDSREREPTIGQMMVKEMTAQLPKKHHQSADGLTVDLMDRQIEFLQARRADRERAEELRKKIAEKKEEGEGEADSAEGEWSAEEELAALEYKLQQSEWKCDPRVYRLESDESTANEAIAVMNAASCGLIDGEANCSPDMLMDWCVGSVRSKLNEPESPEKVAYAVHRFAKEANTAAYTHCQRYGLNLAIKCPETNEIMAVIGVLPPGPNSTKNAAPNRRDLGFVQKLNASLNHKEVVLDGKKHGVRLDRQFFSNLFTFSDEASTLDADGPNTKAYRNMRHRWCAAEALLTQSRREFRKAPRGFRRPKGQYGRQYTVEYLAVHPKHENMCLHSSLLWTTVCSWADRDELPVYVETFNRRDVQGLTGGWCGFKVREIVKVADPTEEKLPWLQGFVLERQAKEKASGKK